jgi:phenylacetate-CoA ligase
MADPPIPDPRQALVALVAHAARHSPHYREQDWARRLRENRGIDLGEIPITLKRTVKAAPETFFSSFVPPEDGKVIAKHTSGSTGEPMPVRKTARHFKINEMENFRLKNGWGLAGHRRVVRVRSHEANLKLGTLTEEPLPGGGHRWTLVSVDADAVFDLLLRSSATLVMSFPSVMTEVLERSLETSQPLQLRLVSTISELVSEELRELVRRTPGCRLVDVYGSVETGLIAAQCPMCGAYHPADRHLVLEVIGQDGSAARPGEMGRIIVTPLFNAAMPLIRYETGDYAILGEQKNCPRSDLAIERILGRERNLFTLPDGRKISPGLPASVLHELGARRFKLVQTTLDEVELRYIPREEHGEITEQAAQAVVDSFMTPGFTVLPVRVTDLPRSASGKYLMHESLI